MAIVLGNFAKSKEIKEMAERTSYNAKMTQLMSLMEMAEPIAQRAKDILDTYRFVEKEDKDFSDKLWKLLTHNKVGGVDINSYFSWCIRHGSVYFSRYGISYYNDNKSAGLIYYCGQDYKEMYRGCILLKDYIKDFPPTEADLDAYIAELTGLITHFDKYADDFFESVSNYNVVSIESN